MAHEVDAGGAVAKVRNPLGVLGLTIITLGIYHFFWWYYVNREMKDFGAAKGDAELADSNPTNSVLALIPGFLIIVPPLVSYYNGVKRIQRTQQLGGVEPLNGWIALVIYILIGFVFGPYLQSNLNKVWEPYPAIEGGEPAPQVGAGEQVGAGQQEGGAGPQGGAPRE